MSQPAHDESIYEAQIFGSKDKVIHASKHFYNFHQQYDVYKILLHHLTEAEVQMGAGMSVKCLGATSMGEKEGKLRNTKSHALVLIR